MSILDAPDPRWEAFAAREPYYIVFPAPRFLRANLTDEIERTFFEDGDARVAAIFRTIELRLAPHFAPTSILEYGCGIGRLALPLARHAARRAGTVTAIDRSPVMLHAARAEAARRGVTNIDFRSPAELFASSRTFDFVNCYLVLQRLRPPEGLLLLGNLLRRLAPGGIGAFHLPYRATMSTGVRLWRSLREQLPIANRAVNQLRGKCPDEPFIATHVYDLNTVLGVLERAGLPASHIVFDDRGEVGTAVVMTEVPLASREMNEALEPPAAGAISVRELTVNHSIAELNVAAERYFASISDWEYHLSKPFSSADETPSLLMDVAVLLQGLQVMPGATVLEFGAGTGWLARFLTQMGCRVILLDVSATALRMARDLYSRLPPIGDRPAPEFLLFDGLRFDLPDASVDRVASFHAFHHVPNPDAVLAELGRILRPGGIAAFAEPGPQHSTTEQSQFEMRMFGVVENDVDVHAVWRTAEACGFRDLKVTISHGPAFHVSLREFEDLLAGGPTSAAWAASTRTYLRNVRNFFLVKEGVERVDSRRANALACEIHATLLGSAAGSAAVAELPIDFDLVITNTGGAVWLPSSAPFGGVAVGVHVHDLAHGTVTTAVLPERLSEGSREIPSGETLRLRARVPAQAAGRYVFEFDCVASRVAWFAQVGSPPAKVAVEIGMRDKG